MSEFPSDWEIANLGAYLKETKERVHEGTATPYSVSKVLGIVPQSEKFKKRVASNDISNYKIIRKGDFAYDPMLLWDGSINRMLREGIGAVSPAYVTFRVLDNSLDANYLLHFLKADTAKNFYKSISKGTNVRRQKAEFRDFASGEFAFPPLPEQKKIAEILSGIDLHISKNEKRVHKLQLSHASLSANTFYIKPETEHLAVALGDVVALRHGYQFRTPDFAKHGAKVIKISQVIGDGVVLTEGCDKVPWELASGKEKFRLKPGDVLMSLTGNIGRVGIVPETSEVLLQNYRVGLFAPINRCISGEYMIHLLESRQVVSQLEDNANASAQANFGKGDLDKIMVYLPDLQTQEKTASLLSSSKDLIKAEKRKIKALRNTKHSVASDLLTGRKRVSI